MTKKTAIKLTSLILTHAESLSDKRTVILYGLELIVSTIIGFSSLALIAFIFNRGYTWVVFLSSFIPLRCTAGGYHANSHFCCYIIFDATYFIAIIIEKAFRVHEIIYILLVVFSLFNFYLFSPIVSPNKPLPKLQIRKNRIISICTTLVFLILLIILYVNDMFNTLAHYFCFGILAASVSLIAAKIKYAHQRRTCK